MLGAINFCFQLINIVTENLLIFTVFGKKNPKNETLCPKLQNIVPRIFFHRVSHSALGLTAQPPNFVVFWGCSMPLQLTLNTKSWETKKLLYMDTTYGSFSEQNSPGSLLHRGQHSHWPNTFSLPPPQYRYLLLEGHQKIKVIGPYIIDMVTNIPYPESVKATNPIHYFATLHTWIFKK